jgi:hypothetical protein
MKPRDVKEYFKTGYKFSRATKMSDNSMHNWIKWGYVPYVSQKKLEIITDGDLVAEWDPKELERREV